jgi:hypothetical protein
VGLTQAWMNQANTNEPHIQNEYFKAYFQRKRAQGLVYKKAMMSVAHKLLRTIFAMMKKREKFNIEHTFSSSSQNLILHS